MFLELAGMALGGLYGQYAASEKERYANQAAKQAELMYSASRKSYIATRKASVSALTVGAMQNTERNRGSAIEAYQAESANEAAAGVSGTQSGSLYSRNEAVALDAERSNERQATAGQYSLQATQAQGEASVASSLVDMVQSLFNWQEAGAEATYAKSALAHGLSIGSGIASGLSMGAGARKGLYQLGVLSDVENKSAAATKVANLFQAGGLQVDTGAKQSGSMMYQDDYVMKYPEMGVGVFSTTAVQPISKTKTTGLGKSSLLDSGFPLSPLLSF